jgi:23S rRNA (cytosine1962-C5)-methyltransferase
MHPVNSGIRPMSEAIQSETIPSEPNEPAAEPAGRETAPGFGVAQAFLKPRKARPFYARHPWVLESAIQRMDGQPGDGDIVDLVNEQGRFIARGIFNSKSRIRLRLYTWDVNEAVDAGLIRRRLQTAIKLRESLGYNRRDGAARLVFSEADALSGLIVDRYGDWLSVQITALGMELRWEEVRAALIELVHPRGIFVRTEKGVTAAEGLQIRDGLVWGTAPDGPTFIVENGIRFGIDLAEGQKTGFYLDQRENRLAAANYFAGRRVLDMFCYSGGFTLGAVANGHAHDALGIDSSNKAIALARANAELNGITQARFETSDCFTALEELAGRREKFGAVIVDPPKFARSRQSLDDALRAYHRLNRLAVDVLEPGGVLVTNSCSGHVTREDFMHISCTCSPASPSKASARFKF